MTLRSRVPLVMTGVEIVVDEGMVEDVMADGVMVDVGMDGVEIAVDGVEIAVDVVIVTEGTVEEDEGRVWIQLIPVHFHHYNVIGNVCEVQSGWGAGAGG